MSAVQARIGSQPEPAGAIELRAVAVCSLADARTVLLHDVTLELRAGDGGLLIAGPSGCGKTTLLRALCGLWPVAAGTIAVRPDRVGHGGVLFSPQRPFLPHDATLAELITYPCAPARRPRRCGKLARDAVTAERMLAPGADGADDPDALTRPDRPAAAAAAASTDLCNTNSTGCRREQRQQPAEAAAADTAGHRNRSSSGSSWRAQQDQHERQQQLLLSIIDTVGLRATCRRVGGLDRRPPVSWSRTLSPGEAQRVALARILYFRPQFAGARGARRSRRAHFAGHRGV